MRGRRHLNCETDARQFAAGGDLGETLGRLPGIGAHQEFDLIAAVGGEFRFAWSDLNRELAAGHAERLHELR